MVSQMPEKVMRQVNYVADQVGFRAQVKTNETGTARSAALGGYGIGNVGLGYGVVAPGYAMSAGVGGLAYGMGGLGYARYGY